MLKERENIIVSATEPTEKNREKVWVQKSENLFNINTQIKGLIESSNGTINTNNTVWNTSDKIYVRASQAYSICLDSEQATQLCIAEYNANNVLIKYNLAEYRSNSNDIYSIITNQATKYVRIGYRNDLTTGNIMFAQTSTKLSYKSYVEPKIHILNDNNVYEEFVFKQEEEKIVLWEGSSLSSIIQLNDKPSDFKYFMIETSVNITVIVPAVINGSGAGGYTAIENSTYVKYETYLRIINLNNSTNTIQFSPSYLFKNNTYSKSANVTKIIGVK